MITIKLDAIDGIESLALCAIGFLIAMLVYLGVKMHKEEIEQINRPHGYRAVSSKKVQQPKPRKKTSRQVTKKQIDMTDHRYDGYINAVWDEVSGKKSH